MQHFYVWKFNKWKRWLIIIVLALFAAVFIWTERDGAFSAISFKNDPVALTKGNTKESAVALTFDISWGEEKVFDILEQLKKENVKATFFVSGEWAERHPSIIEKITKDKHEIGMLGYRYKNYLDQDLEMVRRDMLHARNVFQKLGFKDIQIIRAPSGQVNKDILQTAKKSGLTFIHWNVNPNDWKNPGTSKIADFVMKKTKKGDIILMHASDSVKQTAESLKTILPGLKNKGLNFITISEMMNQAHADSKLVE